MAAKKNTPNKSDFIRSQPATMSATEVVAKAKAAGVTILPGLVYEVRRAAKAKAAKKGGAGAKKSTVAAAPTSAAKAATQKPATQSKADFVRALGTLSAKEVVEKAKAAGMKLDAGYVYNVRASSKKASKGKKAAKSAPRPPLVASKLPTSAARTSKVENLLTAVASEIGLGRAIDILTAERAKVRAALG